MIATWYPTGTVHTPEGDFLALTWAKAVRIAKRHGATGIKDLFDRWFESFEEGDK